MGIHWGFFCLFSVKFVSCLVWPRQALINTDSTYSEFPSLFFPSGLCQTSLDVGSLTCCLGFFRSTSASLEIPELLFTAQKYLPNKLMPDVNITKFGNFGGCSNCQIPFKVDLKSIVCLFLLQGRTTFWVVSVNEMLLLCTCHSFYFYCVSSLIYLSSISMQIKF